MAVFCTSKKKKIFFMSRVLVGCLLSFVGENARSYSYLFTSRDQKHVRDNRGYVKIYCLYSIEKSLRAVIED